MTLFLNNLPVFPFIFIPPNPLKQVWEDLRSNTSIKSGLSFDIEIQTLEIFITWQTLILLVCKLNKNAIMKDKFVKQYIFKLEQI